MGKASSSSMFGFANEKIFVCVNKNIIQSYELYDEKEF